MVHGENRIPYWIDRRLNGLAGPDYDAIISFGMPIEPEDSQYGEYRFVGAHRAPARYYPASRELKYLCTRPSCRKRTRPNVSGRLAGVGQSRESPYQGAISQR